MRRLIVFAGPPCGGKTSAAGLLPYTHLEMDSIRARLLPDSLHTRPDRAVAYRAMLWMAELLIPRDGCVIVDGGFVHAEDRRLCQQVAARTQAGLRVVEFQLPLAAALERNRLRRAHHPGLDLDDARVTELVTTYRWSGHGLTVDGQRSPKDIAESVRSYVEEGSSSSAPYE
jgi:predicted kinase